MGSWGGRYYQDVIAEVGDVVDRPSGLLISAPDGELYPQIAERVSAWLAETNDDPGDRLVIMHGISSRVMRGVMTGQPLVDRFGAPAAGHLPQGSLVMIEGGVETIVHLGGGGETV